jgi:16S rRNA (cytidine1402-2'-O)-methyltransferase
MTNSAGRLFLIPVTLSETEYEKTLPSGVFTAVRALTHFIVEDEKSARRCLKQINPDISFPSITLYPLNEHSKPEDYAHYLDTAEHGTDMGLLSEAGCPCVADPGAQVVRIAQKKNITVVPLTGPSSIILSLMASGFNGQSFTFHGYLPVEKNARSKKIAEIERYALTTGYTQIFIETPYRNNQLLADIIAHCSGETLLCTAANITDSSEKIITRKISEWKKMKYDFNKIPAVFLIGK